MEKLNPDLESSKKLTPEEKRKEDNLELSSLTFFERRKEKTRRLKAELSDRTFLKKIDYLLYYYKWRFAISVLLVFLIFYTIVSIYKNSIPIALSFVVVNYNTDKELELDYFQDYLTDNNLEKNNRIISDTSVYLDLELFLSKYSSQVSGSIYTEFPIKCFNGYYDIILSDEKGVIYCGYQDIATPVDVYLEPEYFNKIKDKLFYAKNIEGEKFPYAINISDTNFAKSLNLGFDDVYLSFPGTSKRNYTNSIRFLDYVLEY